VAQLTKCLKIFVIIGSSIRELLFVMNEHGGCEFAIVAAEFADWMRLQKCFADFFPARTIAFVTLRVSLVLVVVVIRKFVMFVAVASACELGATAKAAWCLGFGGHKIISLHNKSSGNFLPKLFA
jgi:hypothetical protein